MHCDSYFICSQKHPDLYTHFKTNGIELNLTASKWFICLFVDVLPVEVRELTCLCMFDCKFLKVLPSISIY